MIRDGCPRDEFDFLEVIGAGSFGSVHRAVQKSSHKVVAIKIMKRKLTSATECDHLLECKILRLLPPHTNIVKTLDIFFAPSHELYFVLEYMNGGNLYQLIKEKRDTDSFFTLGELRDIMRQTLAAVAHIHHNHIFHRDLKPENLLLSLGTGTPIIKLADFGLARETSSHPPYTEYVSTRWYRAPEVLLRSSNYSDAVDLWAIGTIFAELISRQPLFPGESEIDQLYRICQLLGSPGNKFISSVAKKKTLRSEKKASPGFARRKPLDTLPPTSTMDSVPPPPNKRSRSNTNTASTISLLDGGGEWREGVKLAHRIGFEFPYLLPQPLADVIPEASPSMLDLLHQFLFFNPSQRLKAANALNHSFFSETNTHSETAATDTPTSIDAITASSITTTATLSADMTMTTTDTSMTVDEIIRDDKFSNLPTKIHHQARQLLPTPNPPTLIKSPTSSSGDTAHPILEDFDDENDNIQLDRVQQKLDSLGKVISNEPVDDSDSGNDLPFQLMPPYIGKRRQHSTDTFMMMDDPKLRRTDIDAPRYSTGSDYLSMDIGWKHDDQIHTHRQLSYPEQQQQRHGSANDATEIVERSALIGGDIYHQDDNTTNSSSKAANIGGESGDWLWLKVL
ncbi:kinase-like domain-containing protein [Absidia repens]|uniref:Kinase-like domain-containing protein n=1 Tax=Absidia repens TaxID=90262 RepID=A0A1X2IHV7_9FUNG|nr:kinase-like domain-containing protein [Absidia repens]